MRHGAILAIAVLIGGILGVPAAALAEELLQVAPPDSLDCPDPDHHSVQVAVDAAASGATIELCPGTYVENVIIDRSVALVGTDASTVVLDGGGSGSTVRVLAGTVRIQDVTIRNGSAERGGGIENGGHLTLNSVVVTENTAYGSGGGIYTAGSMTIEASEITANRASGGGFTQGGGIANAIMSDGEGPTDGTGLLVLDAATTVSGNTASGGGGIHNYAGHVTLVGTTVERNRADDRGGGIATQVQRVPTGDGHDIVVGTGVVSLVGATVHHNTAGAAPGEGPPGLGGGISNDGGGVLLQGSLVSDNVAWMGGGIHTSAVRDDSHLPVAGTGIVHAAGATSIARNSAELGGGVSTSGGEVLLEGSTVEENHATNMGGGIFNEAASASPDGSSGPVPGTGVVRLEAGSAVRDNTAGGSGGGISNLGGVVTLLKAQVTGNGAGEVGGGIVNEPGVDESGEAVAGTGVVDVGTGSRISGNHADSGAGIFNGGGEISLAGAIVTENHAGRRGGGILNQARFATVDGEFVPLDGTGILSASEGTTVSANAAGTSEIPGGGGGIINNYGSVTLSDTSVSENTATAEAGGLANHGGSVVLAGSSIVGNVAETWGGGIYNALGGDEAGEPVLGTGLLRADSASAINENSAGWGGGIFNAGGELTIAGARVEGNRAADHGGGVFNQARFVVSDGTFGPLDGTGSLHMTDGAIVADNTAGAPESPGSGGGISNNAGVVALTDSTVERNTASGTGGGVANMGGVATLERLSVRDNVAGDWGGGLYNSVRIDEGGPVAGSGIVDAQDLVLERNVGSSGGGLAGRGGNVALRDVRVTDNSATWAGGILSQAAVVGGEVQRGAAVLSVSGGTVARNTATAASGGGITNSYGILELAELTIADNDAALGGGGVSTSGATTLVGVTLTGNESTGSGGGIDVHGSGEAGTPLTILNSTVSGNASGHGGGIALTGNVPASLHSITVTANSASADGGGIAAFDPFEFEASDPAPTIELLNSIIAGNRPPAAAQCWVEAAASYVSLGFNLGEDDSCGLTTATDLAMSAAGLAPLADNGGPTPTHALGASSPAVDAGPSEEECPAADQRGTLRPQGHACDIGAFELVPTTPGGPPPPVAPSLGAVAGLVTDAAGGPIVGADVTVQGTSSAKVTDDEGAYLIEDLDAGTYTVVASAAGYSDAAVFVEVVAGETATADLVLRRSFADVADTSPHAVAIAALAQAGVTTGCAPAAYCPQAPVTRGQMATFLLRVLGLEAAPGSAFDDVPGGHPHAGAVGALVETGITTGCAAGSFCPDDPVTRGQMATFLMRGLGLPELLPTGFPDAPDGHPHAGAIGALVEAGIAKGFADGTYGPELPITRAQMASLLVGAFDL